MVYSLCEFQTLLCQEQTEYQNVRPFDGSRCFNSVLLEQNTGKVSDDHCDGYRIFGTVAFDGCFQLRLLFQ